MKKIIRIIEVPCKNCNGTGRVFDHAFGLFTFGFGYLVQALDGARDKIDCLKCDGKGYKIRREKIIEYD